MHWSRATVAFNETITAGPGCVSSNNHHHKCTTEFFIAGVTHLGMSNNNNKNCVNNTMVSTEHHWDTDEGAALLLQQHRRSAHEGDPSPVPDHDDEDAGSEECLHGKPYFGEASVLMDALGGEKQDICVVHVFLLANKGWR